MPFNVGDLVTEANWGDRGEVVSIRFEGQQPIYAVAWEDGVCTSEDPENLRAI